MSTNEPGTTWYDDDDRLAEELAVALRGDGPAPESIDMMMAGYDIVMTDTVEADLVHDSDTDELVAVRSADTSTRMLSFSEAETDLEIEFEIVDGRVIGHVDPPDGGQVQLEQPANTDQMVTVVEPDTIGSFEFTLTSPGTFRLRYVDRSRRSVATGWIDGPHSTRR
ncbi:MAG: hypothetical protein AAFO29_11405 [Actinomycetota bacterium]